jgi:chromosome condensin MukBEF complex kleisin-like MukF subunit
MPHFERKKKDKVRSLVFERRSSYRRLISGGMQSVRLYLPYVLHLVKVNLYKV